MLAAGLYPCKFIQRAQITHMFDGDYSKDHADLTASTKTKGLQNASFVTILPTDLYHDAIRDLHTNRIY